MERTSLARASFVRLGTGVLAIGPAAARAAPDARLRDLEPGAIARIRIVHLPASISTRTRLSAAQLAASPDARRLTIDDPPDVVRILAAVRAIVAVRSASATGYDCRWSFRFEAASGKARTLTSDPFGRAGTVDGRPATLHAAAFLAEVERAYPALR